MGCNPLFIRLLAEMSLTLPAAASAVELGNQTFKPEGRILDEVRRFLAEQGARADLAELERLGKMSGDVLKHQTRAYFAALGISDYSCIDINDRYGALVMDLNFNLAQKYAFQRQFDLVTNNGTSEHIFDQATVFRNVHALTRPGGLMVHVLPFFNYINHGFFSFHTVLFLDLARANGYEVVRLSLADSAGDEITFADQPPLTTRQVTVLPSAAGSDQAAVRLSLRGLLSRGGRQGTPMAGAIRSLGGRKPNLLVVAVLRRTSAAPFRVPLQGVYSGANIADTETAERYSA